MKFPSPCLPVLVLVILTSPLLASAQEKAKPSPAADPDNVSAGEKGEAQISLMVEFFQLDHRSANQLVSQFAPRAADAGELRDLLHDKIRKGEAELLETGWLRGRSGNRIKLESMEEYLYATDYDPPEIPNHVGGDVGRAVLSAEKGEAGAGEKPKVEPGAADPAGKAGPAIHLTAATPTSFEVRHLGLVVEADIILADDHQSLHCNISCDYTKLISHDYYTRPESEDTAYGTDHISMPTFYTMRNTHQFQAIPGNTNLVGLHTPYGKPDSRVLCLTTTRIFHLPQP